MPMMLTMVPALRAFIFGHVELAQVDVAEHLERPGLLPALQADVGDAAAGDGAGVVDEDVDVGKGLVHAQALGGIRQVGRVGRDLGIVLAPHLAGRLLQHRRIARGDDDVGAFRREGMGHGQARCPSSRR